MPGMSFVCDFKGHLQESCILASLDSMMHQEDYEKNILLKEKAYLLACTRYKEYPLTCFESDRFVIYLEGQIYGKSDGAIDKELKTVAEWLLQPVIEKQKNVTDWLLNTDGEFFVFIVDKISKSLCCLSDALGRLPVYYRKTGEELRISRELRFFMNSEDAANIDRMGVAQYLLFGYPLGNRTLLNGVCRLPAASTIKIEIGQAQVRVAQLHSFNFEVKQHSVRTLEENTSELVRLFSEACTNRAYSNGHSSKSENILALSGGLDSRTVAASLSKNSIPFRAVTRLDYLKRSRADAEIAEQLARVLNVEWKLFRVKAPRGGDLLRLLRMKNGLNYLGMAFILSFLDRIRAEYGMGISYFTGDGGDKVLRDLRPCWKLKSLDGLVNYICSRNEIFALQKVSALTKISAGDIVAEVRDHVSSFPENDWSQRYVHFLFSERVFKCLFEGEDRNRCFFWSVTPFYAIRFFRYAIECPDQQKEKFALHRSVLLALSPRACSITYADWGTPVSGNQYLLYLFVRSILDRIPPSLKKRVRKPVQRRIFDNHDACLQDQLSNSSVVGEYMDDRVLRAVTMDCSWAGIKNLLTVTSAMEELEGKQSTLSKYCDAEFA